MTSTTFMTPAQALSTGFTALPVAAQVDGTRDDGRRQGFIAGDLGLLLRYEDTSELAEMPEVFQLPRMPALFRGMANLHGMLVPVFHLASFLGASARTDARQMLLVLSHGTDAAGIVIDGLPRRLQLKTQQRLEHTAVPGFLKDCVGDAYRIDGKDWFDVRRDALLERLEEQLAA